VTTQQQDWREYEPIAVPTEQIAMPIPVEQPHPTGPLTDEREVGERVHRNPDSDQNPELTSGLDDERPNEAWNYANAPTRGWGVWSRGQWLLRIDDFGPAFTAVNREAQCFNTDAGAKRLALLLQRWDAKQNPTIADRPKVYIHRIPAH